jgi:uncharacterized protein involved in exopolysaccharide biosynthesis
VSVTNSESDSPAAAAGIAAALKRRWRVLVVSFLALSAGVVAAVLTAAPLYEGKLKILVKRDRADAVVSAIPEQAALRRDREISETEVTSQVELIKSDELLTRVAAEAGLARRVVEAQPNRSEAEALEIAATTLAKTLRVAPVRRTWIIDVRYKGEDRRLTQDVLDTLVRLYLEKHLALQRPAGTHQFFAEQAAGARVELDAVRERLAAFSAQYQVVAAGTEKQATLQKLSEFDAMRAQSAAQLAETTSRLEAVTQQLEDVPQDRTSAVTTDATVISDVSSRIVTLEMKRAELLQKFVPAYRGVREIEVQLAEARTALGSAERTPVREETVADNPTRQWLETERARALSDRAGVSARVRALSGTVGQYRSQAQRLEIRDAEQQDLARELRAAEANFLLYTQKQEEARISDELDRTRIANVVVADGPAVTVEPEREPGLAFLPLLLGIALLLSAGLALAVDALAPAVQHWHGASTPSRTLLGYPSHSEAPLL